MTRSLLALLMFVLCAGPARADDSIEPPPPETAVPARIPPNLPGPARRELRDYLNQNRRQDDLSAGKRFFATEGLFITNSFLASIAPKIYGGAALILFPAGLIGTESGPERNTGLVLMEGLAVYNLLGVDQDEMSEGEIFRTNFAAWHGILIAGAIVHHFAEKRREKLKNLTVVPLKDGVLVYLSGSF